MHDQSRRSASNVLDGVGSQFDANQLLTGGVSHNRSPERLDPHALLTAGEVQFGIGDSIPDPVPFLQVGLRNCLAQRHSGID